MRILKHYKTDRGQRLGAGRHARKATRVATAITAGDTVRVLRGDDKGKEGKVLKVFLKKGRVLVEGINIVKKHRRPRAAGEEGGIIPMAAPIALSNVMLLDPTSGAPTRVRARIDADGTKERIAAKSGDALPRTR